MENVETQFHTLSTIDNIGPIALSVLWPAITRLRDSDGGRVTHMVCKLAPTFCPDKGVTARILSAELAKNGINYNTRDNYKKLGTAGVPELMRLLHETKTRRAALDILTAQERTARWPRNWSGRGSTTRMKPSASKPAPHWRRSGRARNDRSPASSTSDTAPGKGRRRSGSTTLGSTDA